MIIQWTETQPDERDGYTVARIADAETSQYAHVPDGWDHNDVALAYAETAQYSEWPVRLKVWVDWTGEMLPYEMDADRSVTLALIARTGGETWQRA